MTSTSEHVVYASFDRVSALQRPWDDFAEQVGGDIYSTYDWCRVWWRHYGRGRHLQLHIFSEGRQLIAVVPLFYERLRLGPLSLRTVRLVGCDHSVTTCAPLIRTDRMAPVISSIVDHLDRNGPWDLLHFGPLPAYYGHGSALAEALRRCPSVADVIYNDRGGPHIVFDLPESYDAYLGALSRKERHNVRRGERLLDQTHSWQVSVVPNEQVDDAFHLFVQQHQTQWRQRAQLGHFSDWPEAQTYHHEMAVTQSHRNRLMLLRMDADGECVGFNYNYRFGQRLHWILTSRSVEPKWDLYSPGRLLHCAAVRAAIGAGIRQIDGLRGMYDYKLRLGGSLLQLQSVSGIHRGLVSRLRFRMTRFNARLLDLLYYRMWFGRLAPRVPYLQRSLWPVWIRSRI